MISHRPTTAPRTIAKSVITVLALGIAMLAAMFLSGNLSRLAGATTAYAASTADVSITDSSFNSSNLTVAPGTTVRWTNNGANRHRVRDTNHSLFDSGDLYSGGTFSYTFNSAGTYDYSDERDGFTGTITVSGSAATATPGGAGATATPGGSNSGIVDVQMQRHEVFSPSVVNVTTGTTVRWTNMDDGETHTTTSDDGTWNSGGLAGGQQFSFTFLDPGTYHYRCLIHPAEMQGDVIVSGPAISPTPGTPSPSATVGASAGTQDVSIQGFAFQPGTTTVVVGSTIRWTNKDATDHTTTSDTGLWNSGVLAQNGQFTYTFDSVGQYLYHCDRHPGMKGTINVVAQGSTLPSSTPTNTPTATQPTGGPAATATPTRQVTGPVLVDAAVRNYAYSPATITIKVGDTVRWTNYDNDHHSVTATDNSFNSGEFTLNGTYQVTFNSPGNFTYICSVHGAFMTGHIVVESATTVGGRFTDVPPGSTFYPFINCLVDRSVIGGYSDGSFRPGNQATRGQLAKIISNAAGYTDTPAGQAFADVDSSSPFYLYIERMAVHNVIGGYACGGPGEPCVGNKPYFRPGANTTRGQIAKIVAGAANLQAQPTGQTFADVAPTNTFYVYVERLATAGAMSGYNCGTNPNETCDSARRPYFRPAANTTRGQISKIVSGAFFPECK